MTASAGVLFEQNLKQVHSVMVDSHQGKLMGCTVQEALLLSRPVHDLGNLIGTPAPDVQDLPVGFLPVHHKLALLLGLQPASTA